MKKKLITILLAFGIAKAEAEKYLEKVDEADVESFDPEAILSSFREKEKDLLKNDKDFVSEIQKAEAAKRNDMWRTKIKKQTGLTAEEIKDKSEDEIVQMAVEKLRKKGDSTNEQLQAENVALTNELKRLKEEDLPAAQNQAQQIRKQLTIESKVEKLMDSLPKKLRVSKTAAIATLKEKLINYEYELDEKGELTLLTKEGRLKPKSKDGSKILSAIELITESLDEEKLLENSAGTGQGDGGSGGKGDGIQTKPDPKADVLDRFPHLKKAQQHAEEVKQTIEANSK